jgi:nitrite reductase/ring-hydroxylating ferredoxin subunit
MPGDDFVRLGPADLRDGEIRGYPFGDYGVVVVRLGDQHFALENACAHSGAPLSEGRIEPGTRGAMIVCARHDMPFDLATGALRLSERICEDQPRFEIELRAGEIWVRRA